MFLVLLYLKTHRFICFVVCVFCFCFSLAGISSATRSIETPANCFGRSCSSMEAPGIPTRCCRRCWESRGRGTKLVYEREWRACSRTWVLISAREAPSCVWRPRLGATGPPSLLLVLYTKCCACACRKEDTLITCHKPRLVSKPGGCCRAVCCLVACCKSNTRNHVSQVSHTVMWTP